ncbi:MAG: 50S ribosomal protein L7Ae [Candidatus Hodarchaeota archaeon]
MSKKPFYVSFDAPEEIVKEALKILEKSRETEGGKIKRGTNETTKAVERGIAKLVFIAKDVDPPEIVAHLPLLCDEKNIPYIFVDSKENIGEAIGIDVPAAAACIIEAGQATPDIKSLAEKIGELKK